jgi:hypothetical protein
MLALFLSSSTIFTMNPPMSGQDSAKKGFPIKGCTVTNEEVEVSADFLRGRHDPNHLTVSLRVLNAVQFCK